MSSQPDFSHPDSRPLAERYAQVQERIAAAAKISGRKGEEILLVAVTKNAMPDQIRALLDLGHRDLAENKVQNLVQRAAMVDEYMARMKVLATGRAAKPTAPGLFPPFTSQSTTQPTAQPTAQPTVQPRWHMIGHCQRNKARKIVELVRLVHSLDSLRLAEELQTVALRRDVIIEVLLQVDCSGEEGKYGCPMPAAPALAEQIDSMMNVRLRGLMTMAPHEDNAEKSRRVFIRCRELFEEMRSMGCGEGRMNILSMGMSNDFEIAVQEGANMVRVGSAIFGLPLPGLTEPEEREEPGESDGENDEFTGA
jgi:pyridoxal phosphate enzyme (YggS family)